MIGTDLRGKACLVTGCSRGIGAAVARGFGGCGMRVAVHCRGARDEAVQVSGDIVNAGGEAIVLQGDVSVPGVVESLIEQTAVAFGRIDVLVNNPADLLERRPVEETDDALFDQHVALNIRPVVAACRAVVRHFQAQGDGTIINLSSIAARTGGGGGSSIYAGSKAFVAAYSRTLAKEDAADGIRVNCIAPGVLATPTQDRTTPPETLEAIRTQIPQRQIGSAAEAVGTFLSLSSEQLSGYVTDRVVDGAAR
jgi:3-oxoacyl-[acyl-carrier protein] reductase